jgi:hypothetical protein
MLGAEYRSFRKQKKRAAAIFRRGPTEGSICGRGRGDDFVAVLFGGSANAASTKTKKGGPAFASPPARK